MNKIQIQVVAGVTVLVFAVGIVLSGDKVDSAWLKFFSYATASSVGVLALWNRFLWRSPTAQRIPGVPRDIRGTWKGVLVSQWVDPKTKKTPPAKPAYLVVRQTASKLSVTMITDEMRSRSSMAQVAGDDGDVSLDYLYLSRPQSSVEHRSRMHHGSTSLDVSGRPATRLHGHYWTDRDSRGELDFGQRVVKVVDDYESAEKLFQP